MKRRILIPFLGVLTLALVATAAGHPVDVTPAQAATCSSYSNQAAAQRAHDTRDAAGDGVYSESLPCPCAKGNAGGASRPPVAPSRGTTTGCTRPRGVVSIGFSATKYRHTRADVQRALRRGWARVLVLNRPGADARRERLLSGRSTRPGMDRDEY